MLLLLSSRPAATFLQGPNLDYQDKETHTCYWIWYTRFTCLDLKLSWLDNKTQKKGFSGERSICQVWLVPKSTSLTLDVTHKMGKYSNQMLWQRNSYPHTLTWLIFIVCKNRDLSFKDKGEMRALDSNGCTSISHFLLSIVSENIQLEWQRMQQLKLTYFGLFYVPFQRGKKGKHYHKLLRPAWLNFFMPSKYNIFQKISDKDV